jgi:hypothetical protein
VKRDPGEVLAPHRVRQFKLSNESDALLIKSKKAQK